MIYNTLNNYLSSLSKAEEVLQSELQKYQGIPKSRVIVSKVKGRFIQCFLSTEGEKTKRQYLPKRDWSIAFDAAQREYDEELLSYVKKQQKTVQQFLSDYNPSGLRDVYMSIPEVKRTFIKPLILTDEEFIAQWYQKHPGNQNTIPFAESYPTERGEQVRSKSEKIIADKLFYMGIPYVYEAELQLGRKTIYPDFTILNVRTRETKYLEHFGKMDNQEYGKNVIRRIDLFHSYGIWEGEKLFFTMENSIAAWNMGMFEKLIQRYFV